MTATFQVLRDLLRYNREFLIGFTLTAIIFVYAALNVFAPLPPNALYLLPPDMPPSAEYWFGTTSRGQDVFWQMSAAIWNTMTFGLVVTILSRLLALLVGLISGYLGGRVDQVLMAVNDTLIALPNIPILLLVYFVLRDQMSWPVLAVVAALLGWIVGWVLWRWSSREPVIAENAHRESANIDIREVSA